MVDEHDFLVTELSDGDLELRLAAALRVSEEKSRKIAALSHALRTPLNSILGFSELLLSDLETLSAAQRDSLEEIRKAGSDMLVLLDEAHPITFTVARDTD